MISDLFNEWMDSNENATESMLLEKSSGFNKLNDRKANCATIILSAMAAKQPATDDHAIQEQVNLSIKYADTLFNTIRKIEYEQFTKARKRIK